MSQLPIIDLAVGLSYTYLLLSLLCTIINELIAQMFSLRSSNLKTGIKQILADSGTTDFGGTVLNHPLIGSSAGKKGPSYISPANFALVLVDLLDSDSKGAARLASTRDELCKVIDDVDEKTISKNLKVSLKSLVGQNYTKIEDFQKNTQLWFDISMDRVSGWYKRKTQIISLVVALFLTVILNVDTIHLANRLWENPVLLNQINQQAIVVTNNNEDVTSIDNIKEINQNLKQMPIGWDTTRLSATFKGKELWSSVEITWNWFTTSWEGVIIIVGWLITILAISMGAPFWFDILNKFINIRSSGLKPASVSTVSNNESS